MTSHVQQADSCVRCLVDETERAWSMIWQALNTDGNVSPFDIDDGPEISERSRPSICLTPWCWFIPARRFNDRFIELHYAPDQRCWVAFSS